MMNKRFEMKNAGRKVCFILLIFLLLPNLLEAGEYRAKGWGYLSVGEVGPLLPAGFYARLIGGAAGFAPPVGLGIGTAIGETTIMRGGAIFLLAPLYGYLVPYIDARRDGLVIQVLYTSVSYSGWGIGSYGESEGVGNFLRFEIGYRRCAFPPRFYVGIKAGFIWFMAEDEEKAYTPLYAGVTFYWGGWRAFIEQGAQPTEE